MREKYVNNAGTKVLIGVHFQNVIMYPINYGINVTYHTLWCCAINVYVFSEFAHYIHKT